MTQASALAHRHKASPPHESVGLRLHQAKARSPGLPRFLQRRAMHSSQIDGGSHPVQRQKIDEEELLPGRFEAIQRQDEEEDEGEEALQGKFAWASPKPAPAEPELVLNRTGMPDQLKAGIEALSGVDLSGVRVHSNSSKPAQLNAWAYTQGQDVYLGPGQEKHLPHEAWHAVQQAQGRVKPTVQAKGALINDDTALEREADDMGARALQRMPFGPNSGHQMAPTSMAGAQASHGIRPTIQRAMKFEYQIKDPSIKNRVLRDDGTNILPLPRKYGPEDFLVKGKSGVTLESETHGQLEFETGWSRNWVNLNSQIDEARQITDQMNAAVDVVGSDGKTYQEFPFSVSHLGPGQGFRMRKHSSMWDRNQPTGKARVISQYLDVRSGAGRKFESLDRLAKSDVVEVLETKGRWSRINNDKITGWVLSRYLKPIFKRYESNVNKHDPSGIETGRVWSRDTVLRPHEQMLLEIKDRTWMAYIQVSESFGLDQFESFFKQFGKSSDVDSVIHVVDQTMSAYNPAATPPPDLMPDDSSMDRMRKITVAAAAKMMSDVDFATRSSGLKNLLLMVVYYIKKGAGNLKKDEPEKWAFPLMSRTNFGSIYMSLPEAERDLFSEMVHDNTHGIPAMQGLNRATRWYAGGHTGPTVYDWLVGITKGKDLLSGGGFSAAMGRFRIDEEVKSQKGLIRFESRESEYLQPAGKWVEHAINLFTTAMRDRPRDSGKEGTGLKWGWKELLESLGF